MYFSSTRPRDKSERMQQAVSLNSNPKPVSSVSPRQSPSSPRRQQYVIVPRPTPDADPEDFSRRLKISSSPSPRPSESTTKVRKLFNPDTDPIPMKRTTDPEPTSVSTGTQQPSRPPSTPSTNHRDDRGNTARHLFNHRRTIQFVFP